MRLRHIPGAEEEIAGSPYVIQNPREYRGRWALAFGN
ncbi:MAG: tRNA (guanosine(46)-N7)-methyltransferase TrmB, partial [Hungatella sp.]|nr:tRNA (guanosine(46)-N7)-methyltransferase TrmB [Hungatella sp.]